MKFWRKTPKKHLCPKYISEVRAFRALYYYYLLDMFARGAVGYLFYYGNG